jgi:hypothetical protein
VYRPEACRKFDGKRRVTPAIELVLRQRAALASIKVATIVPLC